MPEPRTGVLAMAYGSPEGEEGIAPYYTHIRGGRPPSACLLYTSDAADE